MADLIDELKVVIRGEISGLRSALDESVRKTAEATGAMQARLAGLEQGSRKSFGGVGAAATGGMGVLASTALTAGGALLALNQGMALAERVANGTLGAF